MSYPESDMNVAVHMGDGEVKIFGWEKDGYRPRHSTQQFATKPKAITYCLEYNASQRARLGSRP